MTSSTLHSALRVMTTVGSGAFYRRSVDGRPAGVVFVEGERVCWGRSSGQKGRMSDLLIDEQGGVTRAVLESAVERCRATGRPFGEVLVREGVVRREVLRSALLQHTCEALRELDRVEGTWERKAPGSVGYDTALTFSAADLLTGLYALDAPEHAAAVAQRLRGAVLRGQRAFAVDDDGTPIAHVDCDRFGVEAMFELARQARELMALSGFALARGVVAVLESFACAVWSDEDTLHVIVDDDDLAFNRLASQMAAIDP